MDKKTRDGILAVFALLAVIWGIVGTFVGIVLFIQWAL